IFSDSDVNSLIRFDTLAGTFDVELFDQFAPNAVHNFFSYINSGRFTSTIFHSATAGVFLQGGEFHYVYNPNGSNRLDPVVTNAPVTSEPGLSNLIGTLATTPENSQATSETSQFLFNLANNSTGGGLPLDAQNVGLTV